MRDLFDKNKNKIIKYGVLGFVGFLFIVQLPYWIGNFIVIIQTDYAASDVLAFLGNYISACGTIVLGWIAIKQTDQANGMSEKANNISDRVAQLEIAKHIAEHDPVVLVDWVKLHDFSYNNTACNVGFDGQLHYIEGQYDNNINEQRQCIEINLINTGRTGIYNCQLEEVNSTPTELKRGTTFLGIKDAPFVLKTGKEVKFNLFMYSNIVERFAVKKITNIQLVFSCVNDFNEKYTLFFDVEGAFEFHGNNRCEGQLVPCPHPVKWTFRIEKKT